MRQGLTINSVFIAILFEKLLILSITSLSYESHQALGDHLRLAFRLQVVLINRLRGIDI